MEDVQPNEVRLSRKGSTSIPLVHTTSKKCNKWVKDHRSYSKRQISTHTDNSRIKRQRQHPIAKARENNVPGPSRANPGPRTIIGCLDSHPSTPSSPYSFQREPIEPKVKVHHVQTIYTNVSPRQRSAAHTAPPTENIIDLTLDPPSPLAGQIFVRWSSFQSGCVDIHPLPLSDDSGTSPLEQNSDPSPSIQQEPAHIIPQRENCSSSLARPNIRTNHSLMEAGRSLSDQSRPLDGLEAPCSSFPSEYSVALEDETEMFPSSPDYSHLVHTFTCDYLPLSLGSRDRPRRVLRYNDSAYVVTAHGVIDQVRDTGVSHLNRNIRSPALPFEEFIDDACILSHQGEPVLILGHAREENQITLMGLGHSQVSQRITLRRDRNAVKKPGASAVTTLMSPLKFASGGYDHRVHLWDIAQDFSGASTVELAIKHASVVHSLLPIVDTSHKLVSVGADRQVSIYDMSAERVVHSLKVSCMPFHAHKIDFPSCTLLEVAHLETQFEVYDHRVSHQAVQRFGFITTERRGRYEKADTWSHFVVGGDKNGVVHLWDLRNVSVKVTLPRCFNDPVLQVVKTSSRLLACSKRNELAYIGFVAGEG